MTELEDSIDGVTGLIAAIGLILALIGLVFVVMQ